MYGNVWRPVFKSSGNSLIKLCRGNFIEYKIIFGIIFKEDIKEIVNSLHITIKVYTIYFRGT